MIELLESRLSSSGQTPNQSMVEYMDDWIAEVLLGQPPRNGGGGALAAAASEREQVRIELSQADSDLLSETLNRTLLQWICELNGLQPCTVSRTIKKEEDKKAQSETDVNVASMGFKPTLDAVRERYGEGWEEAAAPANPPESAPGKPVVDNANPAFAEGDANAGPDAMQQLIDAELAQWEPLLEPMVAPVQALLDAAAREGLSAQQVLDRLPQALARMDADPLAQALTRTAFAARLGAASGLPLD